MTTQVTSSQPAEPTWRAMSAETMKIPEPIIDPATSIVESRSPSSRADKSFALGFGGGYARGESAAYLHARTS